MAPHGHSAAPMPVPVPAGELLAVEVTSILGRPTFSAKQIVATIAAWPKRQFSVAVVRVPVGLFILVVPGVDAWVST